MSNIDVTITQYPVKGSDGIRITQLDESCFTTDGKINVLGKNALVNYAEEQFKSNSTSAVKMGFDHDLDLLSVHAKGMRIGSLVVREGVWSFSTGEKDNG